MHISIQPTVLLAIADHKRRVLEEKASLGRKNRRVIGILVGTVAEGTIEVSNSYSIPFEEHRGQSNSFYIDTLFQKQMFDLYHKVYSYEAVVGWYSTSEQFLPSDPKIHKTLGFTDKHILLCTDCEECLSEFEKYKSPVTAYAFDSVNSELKPRFVESCIEFTEVEQIAINKRDDNAFDIRDFVESLGVLDAELKKISKYLNTVGDDAVNSQATSQILSLVQDAINLLSSGGKEMSLIILMEARNIAMGYTIGKLMSSIVAIQQLVANKQKNA